LLTVEGSTSFCLPNGPLTSDESTTDRAGRLMPAPNVSVHTTTASNFFSKSSSTLPVLGKQPGMMHSHTPAQHLLELGADALFPFELITSIKKLGAYRTIYQRQSLKLLTDAPALITVEAEDQGGQSFAGVSPSAIRVSCSPSSSSGTRDR